MISDTDRLQIAVKNREKEQRDRCECDSVSPAFKGHSELDWEDVWATEKMQTTLFTPSLHFSSQTIGSHALVFSEMHLCNDFVFPLHRFWFRCDRGSKASQFGFNANRDRGLCY